jgi:uncharacterized membrane protein YhaH (DUF805 family)
MGKLRLMVRPLRHYADFEGYSPLKEFWLFTVFSVLISIPFAIGDALIDRAFPVAEPFQLALTLLLYFPNLALRVRRLHSVGLSGWWLFTGIGFFFLALLANGVTGHLPWGRYLTSAFTVAVGLNVSIVCMIVAFMPARFSPT